MAQSRLIVIPLLLLSIIAVGKCGSPIKCSSSNAIIRHTAHGKTASSNDWKKIDHVVMQNSYENRAHDCRKKCEQRCVDEEGGSPQFEAWPDCVAFSSYVSSGGGTCWCYGWDSKPDWYSSSGYRSGWCESA